MEPIRVRRIPPGSTRMDGAGIRLKAFKIK